MLYFLLGLIVMLLLIKLFAFIMKYGSNKYCRQEMYGNIYRFRMFKQNYNEQKVVVYVECFYGEEKIDWRTVADVNDTVENIIHKCHSELKDLIN